MDPEATYVAALKSEDPTDTAMLVIDMVLERLRQSNEASSKVLIDVSRPRWVEIVHDGPALSFDRGLSGSSDVALLFAAAEELRLCSGGAFLEYERTGTARVSEVADSGAERILLKWRDDLVFDPSIVGIRMLPFLQGLALVKRGCTVELRSETLCLTLAYPHGCADHLRAMQGGRAWLGIPLHLQLEGLARGQLAIAWGHHAYHRTAAFLNGRPLANLHPEDTQLVVNAIARSTGTTPAYLTEQLRRFEIGFDCVWSMRAEPTSFVGPTPDRARSDVVTAFLDEVLSDFASKHAAMIRSCPPGPRTARLDAAAVVFGGRVSRR